ncbi:hypothetical protein RJT34_15598 [Clitoria ternatea]|uniref:Transmembrane protein n=1 Tax=Clitoria ternatea TaxID=43366 RepID=A0AAN9PC46_CLITE
MADLVRQIPISLRGTQVTLNTLVNVNMAVETNPLHSLIAFIFFVLLGFLQITYQANPTPLLELHPKTTIVSIASFIVYSLAFWVRLKFVTLLHHCDTVMEVFGSLSLVSLVLMLLPHTRESLRFITYTVWFIGHVLALWRRHQQFRRRVPRPLLPTTSMDI